MSTFTEIAEEIGQLVTAKNEAYGSSFAKAGEFLRLLYPEGLTPAQYDDALLLVRVFDKTMRIATDKDAFGESPWSDIAGYGLLGVAMHHQRKEQRAWAGTANVPDATPSPSPSTPPASSCDAPVSESDPTATDAASGSEEEHRRLEHAMTLRQSQSAWSFRASCSRCIACGTMVGIDQIEIPLWGKTILRPLVCGLLCSELIGEFLDGKRELHTEGKLL